MVLRTIPEVWGSQHAHKHAHPRALHSGRQLPEVSGRRASDGHPPTRLLPQWPPRTVPFPSRVQRGEAGLPKVSEFFGISIYLYWGDHEPAHFHARYAGSKASIAIADLTLLRGELPPRALGLVMEWAAIHQGELQEAWKRVMNHEDPGSIEPLR
jgi:hypothetical protein